MEAAEAEAYHRAQIAAFVEGGADMVTAYTLTSINEAIASHAQSGRWRYQPPSRLPWRRTAAW